MTPEVDNILLQTQFKKKKIEKSEEPLVIAFDNLIVYNNIKNYN